MAQAPLLKAIGRTRSGTLFWLVYLIWTLNLLNSAMILPMGCTMTELASLKSATSSLAKVLSS